MTTTIADYPDFIKPPEVEDSISALSDKGVDMALLAWRLNQRQSWLATVKSWQYIRRNLVTAKCGALDHGLPKQNPLPVSLLCIKTSRPDTFSCSDKNSELSVLFRGLSIRDCSASLSSKGHQSSRRCILPSVPSNTFWKKTIIAPSISHLSYSLPTSSSKTKEKVTPSLDLVFPIQDPNPIQSVLDQGAPPISKQTMPWLIQIRKKKMKKHKLRKLRKRMRFVYRRQREVKAKRKEKAIQMEEKQILKEAEDFDPHKFVEEELKKARLGGWSIDIMEEYHQTKKSKSATQSSQTADAERQNM